MVFWISIAVYTAVILFVWGFFLVAKMHVYKFKDYSSHIMPVTKFLSMLLLVLTVIGYIVIYRGSFVSDSTSTTTVKTQAVEEQY